MKRLLILFTLCLTFLASQSFAQENCNNNLDDDGDGLIDCRDGDCPGKVCEICDDGIDNDGDFFIDCYDKECSIDPACKGFFLGKVDSCSVKPTTFPPFEMKLKYESEPSRANHVNRLIVGDVDNDGTPEIVTTYRSGDSNAATAEVNILQAPGTPTGTLIRESFINTKNDGFQPTFEDIAMADINKDGIAELFILTSTSDGNNYKIIAYEADGTKIWTNPISYASYPGTMGLADFDGDGYVELYTRTQIFDAHSGTLMGQNLFNNDLAQNSNGPIAVDILSAHAGLELVAGCRIYSVAINRPSPPPAIPPSTSVITLQKQRSEYFTRRGRTSGSATSVADFDQDGFLDVVAVGSTIDNATNTSQNTTIFFWDVQNDILKTYIDAFGTGDYQRGWKNGAGRINIADIDGDTLMNAVYVSGRYMYALEEGATDLALTWRENVVEETSGYTGCTMFDFNADGKSEIVYRDEDYLYIFTTQPDGTVVRSTPVRCSSRTSNEYPIVADMNGDGTTEICVACSTTNSTLGRNLSLWDEAVVRVYESANEPWVPARRVWNQHGYFVVNVNDDLTIPKQQQLHHLVYAKNAQCRDGGSSRPLNSFLNQSPYLNSFGCPSYPRPNLSVLPYDANNAVAYTAPICPVDSFQLSFKFMNRGDIGISGNVKVSFYNGDPMLASPLATRLATKIFSMNELNPGDTVTMTTWVKGPGSTFRLFIVLNDNGTTIPLDLENQVDRIIECNYDNIIDALIRPERAPLTPELIRDNIKCSLGAADNGAVRAYVPMGAVKDSVNFNFYWSKGTVAKPIATVDHVGPSYAGVGADTYTVYAIHKVAGCSTVVADVVVNQTINLPTATVSKLRDNDSCVNPNGGLKVVVNDTDNDGVGDPVGNFTYSWYEGSSAGIGDTLSISHTINGLKSGSYSVFVRNKATGCVSPASGAIVDLAPIPVIDTTHTDINCSNLPTGVASAWVNPPKTTTGYTFYWSDGNFAKPTEDFKGADYINRPAGTYTVVAEHNSSKCKSDTITVTIKQTPSFVVSVTSKKDQTSCDVAQPNGGATASVAGGTTGYRFDWYSGQNTIDPAARPNTNVVSNFAAGIYTVKATDLATGCESTDTVNIFSRVVIPTLTASGAPMTKCQPLDGAVTAIPSSGAIADYTFTWYNGDFVKPVTDYPGITGNSLSGLKFGHYAVKAFNNVTRCQAIADSAVVKNLTPTINITVVPNPAKYPTDCATMDGVISATINSTGNTNGYSVDWFAGVQPILGSSVQSKIFTTNPVIDSLAGIASGFYTIKVINEDDNCQAFKEYFLPSKASDSLSVTGVDLTQCTPVNGSVTAHLIINPNTPVQSTNNDYQFQLFKYNNAVPLATILGNTNPVNNHDFTFSSLDSGRYYVKGTAFGSSTVCDVFSEVIELKHNAINPGLALDSLADINCTAAAPAGQVIALATGPAAVKYDFYTGIVSTDTEVPIQTGASNTLLGQSSGFYTAKVTAVNGCFNIQSIFVPADSAIVVASVTPLPRTLCNLNDGQLTISSVTEITPNTSSTNLFNPANYSVTWSVVDSNLATPGILESLDSGTYALQITNVATGCKTPMINSTVEDLRVYPTVDLTAFILPTRCLNIYDPSSPDPGYDPVTGQRYGSLTITSAGATSIRWFSGDSTTDPEVLPAPGANFTGITIPATQDSIIYTVEVLNANNCPTVETYVLPVDSIAVNLLASSTPLTFCTTPDGGVYAIVISALDKDRYSYEWYAGTATTPPVASPATKVGDDRELLNQPDGVYLIVATDLGNATCVATDTVTVDDLRVFPIVTAVPLNPMTNCDDTKPDGTASASVGGNTIDYAFDWFRQTNPSDTMAVGSQVSNLADSTYTVIASHIVTGCSDTTQVTIEFIPVGIKNPTIQIVSHVTSCVENNGALSVSVEGNTVDYVFEWYIGTVEKPSPDYVGYFLDSLAIGTYSVKATSKITGCVSPLVSAEILSLPVYPEFKIEVKPSPCDEDGGEIFLTVTNGIQIDSIIWEGPNGQVLNNPVLMGIPAGHYTVTVFSQLGCPASQEVDVTSEIHPFNGISRNGDGQNDYFHINCIDEFPDNVVRIFNRAGTMVYEEEGYDNLDLYFDGRSNKGVSLMGTNLPDGTYFYVIDKRNGSKPIAGYLEIVN